MDSQMGKYNSNERKRVFNQILNDSNLNLSYLPDFIEKNSIDFNEWSNYAREGISMSGTSHMVSDLVSGVKDIDLKSSEYLSNNTRSSFEMQNLWHALTTSFFQSTPFHGASRTVSDFTSGVTNTDFIPSESLSNNGRSSLQTQNLRHAPTTLFSQSLHFHGASRTVSDFVTDVTNIDLVSSKNHPNNVRSSPQTQNLWNAPTVSFSHSTNFHGPSRTVSDFVEGVTNTDLISSDNRPNNARSSPQTQNLWNAPTVLFSHRTNFHGPSRTVSDFVEGVTNTDLISIENHSNNARISPQTQNLWNAPTVSFSHSTNFHGPSRTVSDFVEGVTNTSFMPSKIHSDSASNSLQMQKLWHAPTASFSQNTYFHGASSMDFVENSTHQTFFEQHTNFGGGSSSTSRNQSNAFIQPSGGPVRYLREHELGDTGRHVNFLRNNIDPQSPSLVIGESVAGGSIREIGHRDDPIVIEDDEEDEHDDAQQDEIPYYRKMSYEAFLALQEHIGGVETELKKSVISKLLKQSKYQSTKMKNYSDSCSICLGTSDDGAELGKINCGHEFHFQCIRKWMKRNNSCPICRRIILTP